MVKRIHRVTTIVARIEQVDPLVKLFHLQDPEGWELPPFTAGAHIDIHLPSGLIRQYSLSGDPACDDTYTIAVQREEDGRGGSRELHDALHVGDELLVSLPRNTFPILDDAPVTMIAGGIGITPFLSALPGLIAMDRPFKLHYCASSRDKASFAAMLEQMDLGSRLQIHISEGGQRLDLAQVVAELASEEHLYCCGPTRMLDAVEDTAGSLGARLHVEHFGVAAGADPAYEVLLARSGQVVPVAPGQTMLQALRAADVHVPASCEGGVCLDCKCRWLEGTPIHRELTMTKKDREEWITPCVSGSASERLTLDL
ncbi:oxidoreductase [Sulfitobacter sp. S0837]|uniref:PDR/VanB family oxidoreductase n=1 Tax=Sulfitobacter maritimus TaxID=2741719 RepID=UPI00158281D9|nr:PDR/VanB family oxidoreductase [Sulfitobacter maritimus]NUH65440.1 oxidoreductase [Sulfitobacter maritimus]